MVFAASQPTDEDYRTTLFRSFDLIDELMRGTHQATLWPDVLNESQADLDNRETNPFQFTHIVQTLLNNAIEHLHAVAALVRRAGLLHDGPPFTLCRAAVESAATAYWMLVPSEQKERLKRHLTYVRQDTFDYEQVANIAADRAATPRDTDTFDKRRAWAKAVKDKHHITGLPNKLEYERMIKQVDEAIADQDGRKNDQHIETYWKVGSAFGHGRQWAMLQVLVREEIKPIGNATAMIRLGNTESRVLWGTSAGYELINRAWHLYYTACGHSAPEQEVGE